MARRKSAVKAKSAARQRRSRPTEPVTVAPAEAQQADPKPARRLQAPFYTVAIGSSAGGVEALEEFFRNLPDCHDAAFVVLSHQSPHHPSMLPELLRRWTSLPVMEATDGLAIQHGHIYLPRPGAQLAILHAVFHLIEGDAGVRPVLPIDYFFCSLAEDQQDKAIGIVLSGTGSDGSLGIKAIKAESGITMAQEPQSAKYAGMPQHAISTGSVDFVKPASELGLQLCDFLRHRTVASRVPTLDDESRRDLTKLWLYLRDRTGNDFSLYKDNTTMRRIERRMNIHQIATLSHYLRYVQVDPAEGKALFQELLIGVTSFFRDPPVFDALAEGLPQLLDDKPEGYTVRAWVPACSTGEEAYSLAILLQEYANRHKRRLTFQVFATDIDAEAIVKARQGLYPEGIANHVSHARLTQFFLKEDSHYRVNSEIRDRITFAPHNLLKDPPFTKVDVLLCRNFLIYLRPETQQWLIPLFHYALRPNGFLVLGNAETIDGFTTLFSPLNRQARVYVRIPGQAHLSLQDKRLPHVGTAVDRSTPSPAPAAHRPSYLVESIHAVLLDRFVPPGVFVNRQGQAVYIHGRTGDYLEPAPGPASQQVVDMTRPGLRRDLIAALQLAKRQGATVVRKGIRMQTQEKALRVTLTVTPLYNPEVLQGLLLVNFETESARSIKRPATARHRALADEEQGVMLELEYTQQRLQRANEELQLSNEEFKSANEEFQSTNEELQSTNEELETTKEELQSLNEELVTVNAQLQSKLDELSGTNDDLQNLINSTEVATVFLDNEFRIKRFTPEAARISKVIASDIGRPFSDIVTKLRYDGLMEDARSVLQTLVYKEREVEALDGRWYLLRMVPYRTTRDMIDGLVLTFTDVTTSKVAGQHTREAQLYAESIVDTVREPLLVLDTELRVVTANRSFCRVFQSERADVERHRLDRIVGGRLNQPALRAVLEKVLAEEPLLEDIELNLDGETGCWMANARRFQPSRDHAPLVLLALEKVGGPVQR